MPLNSAEMIAEKVTEKVTVMVTVKKKLKLKAITALVVVVVVKVSRHCDGGRLRRQSLPQPPRLLQAKQRQLRKRWNGFRLDLLLSLLKMHLFQPPAQPVDQRKPCRLGAYYLILGEKTVALKVVLTSTESLTGILCQSCCHSGSPISRRDRVCHHHLQNSLSGGGGLCEDLARAQVASRVSHWRPRQGP